MTQVRSRAKSRLTTTHKPGTGDDGHSWLLKGNRKVAKGSPAGHFYGSVERLQLNLAAFLAGESLQADVDGFSAWLIEACNSLSAWAWTQGTDTRNSIPLDALAYLESTTSELQQQYGNAPDFQTWQHPTLRELNEIRIQCREVERWYEAWWHSKEMAWFLGHPEGVKGVVSWALQPVFSVSPQYRERFGVGDPGLHVVFRNHARFLNR